MYNYLKPASGVALGTVTEYISKPGVLYINTKLRTKAKLKTNSKTL